jgi:26S proteasome regulatory subunit N3
MIVLNLLLNELPSIETFAEVPKLRNYKELVKVVSQGHNEEFTRYLILHKAEFDRDLVYPMLTKLRIVVLRNAVKKLSIAYTRISVDDVLTKIGIKGNNNFDLQSFLVKSKDYLEDFSLDPTSNIISFARNSENYSDAFIRDTLNKRIENLNMLEEQVVKSLKYPETQNEHKEKEEEDEDVDELDFSFGDLDL